MKLYLSPTSPFARKVKIALLEKRLPFEEIRVDPWATPPELAAANPLSQVPTLITDAGEPLGNSDTIMAWLEHTFPRPALLPTTQPQLTRALRSTALAQGMIEMTVHIVLERRRPQAQQSEALIERREASLQRGVAVLERDFAASRAHFHLDAIGIAVALAYLDFRLAGYPWRAEATRLAEWQAWAASRASMQASAPPSA
ncbi:glutathione S-transferase N-terminal domain-containing protein [Metallibacterium sp.]|uniref:glutathione S-transferase N-terminal domain-containing protein n=1 Tax=Metallibacterium sp. TaxID=2940281 RepID=UPI0026177DB8|nr:glutathione S-transferase N-terminal domain-containing protein [Metallibacterium sp.]